MGSGQQLSSPVTAPLQRRLPAYFRYPFEPCHSHQPPLIKPLSESTRSPPFSEPQPLFAGPSAYLAIRQWSSPLRPAASRRPLHCSIRSSPFYHPPLLVVSPQLLLTSRPPTTHDSLSSSHPSLSPPNPQRRNNLASSLPLALGILDRLSSFVSSSFSLFTN